MRAARSLAGTLLLLVAAGAVAGAQATPLPSPVPVQSGTVIGPHARRGGGMWRLIETLNGVTPSQRQQLETIRVHYEQSHPADSMPNRSTMQSLRADVMHVLTPAQQAQFRTKVLQLRLRRQQQAGLNSPSPSPR